MTFVPFYSEIQLEEEDLKNSEKYGELTAQLNKPHYADRAQTNEKKLKSDGMEGKCGEVVVAKSLRLSNECVDFEAYPKEKKSFNPDIICYGGNYRIHCKEQNEKSSKRYGYAWVFQFAGIGKDGKITETGHKDRLFKFPQYNDIIALTIYNTETKVGQLLGFVHAFVLTGSHGFPNLTSDPEKQELVGLKKVLKLDDIKEYVYDFDGITKVVQKTYDKMLKNGVKFCSKCKGGVMLLRKGPYSDFYGCSGFPYCEHTSRIKQ